MFLRRLAVAATSLALSCGGGAGKEPIAKRAALPEAPPSWCSAVEGALGATGEAGFQCLEVPNFLVTGFYGTAGNPERSDFVNGCFAGEEKAAELLRLAVRPAGNLGFRHASRHRVSAGGSLDLGFLGPWAPRIGGTTASEETVSVDVELSDAEIRVLSSVAEILGQRFRDLRDAGPDEAGNALETCLGVLCETAPEPADALVYTAKVLAAVPIIRVRSTSSQARGAGFSLAKGTAGFEVNEEESAHGVLELRAKEKLNIAALLEPARQAFEQAHTCQSLRDARARREVVADLRDLGLATLASRGAGTTSETSARLRATLAGSPGAFTDHERRDLQISVEALDAASRDLALQKPGKGICQTRDMLQTVLTGGGADNRLHDLLTDIAQPLHRRLTEAANDHALPCADPIFYRDQDGDGFGDAKTWRRAPKQPQGFVENSLDCFDRDARARPGQRSFFTEPRTDGSYDYDCDARESPEHQVVAGGCQAITRFGIPIECWAEAGWREKAPRCGEQGRWLAECIEGMLSCDPGPQAVRRQGCR